MPTYSKETALYDTGAIAAGLDAAGNTADTYITAVDQNGITVHPARSNWSTTGGRTNINSSGMTVYVGSDDVAFYGATARIGKSNSDRVTVDSTNGITIYKGNSKRLQTTANGVDVYGSDGSTSIASFGSSTRIGKPYVSGASNNESHMELDYHSLRMVDREGKTYFHVSDLRDSSGTADITVMFIGDGETRRFYFPAAYPDDTSYTVVVSDGSGGTVTKSAYSILFSQAPSDGVLITVQYTTSSTLVKAYTAGFRHVDSSGQSVVGPMSFAEGYDVTAIGFASHAEGVQTNATSDDAHAEGSTTTASGISSHAEGTGTTASGYYSHAEGTGTAASGYGSHAEGSGTVASARAAHAEGGGTTASGYHSHAEGISTLAKYDAAHAQNLGTIAAKKAQTAIGTFNVEDTSSTTTHPNGTTSYGDYALIVGNGTADDARSNAFTVGWDGRVTTSRDILVTSTSDMSSIITAGSGITIDIFKFCQRSNVASILLRAKKSTVTAANTAITVGTVVADRCPPFECAGPGTSGVGDCWIDETGVVKFRSTSQIAASANFYVRVTYPVA